MSYLIEEEDADEDLQEVVEDECVGEVIGLPVLHVARPPGQHEVQVRAHDGDAWHRALYQEPVIRPGI